MASSLFTGLDNRSPGNRATPIPEISTSARRQFLADVYRPSVFDSAMITANEESRNLLQRGRSLLGIEKFKDITGSVVDEQFRKTFADVDPAKIKEGLPTNLPEALTLEDIMAGTTMEERKKVLVDRGELKDERVFLEESPLNALGYGDDFIHRVNESSIPEYDPLSAYAKVKERITATDEFRSEFQVFVQDNYETENLENVSEERLKEMESYFFNIYKGKDSDEEYQKYLSGELKDEYDKGAVALDILKRRDYEALQAHEAELERSLALSQDSTGMQMLKLMGGSIMNPIDLTIIAGDVLIGTKGAASVGSKFSMIARVMEKAKLMNNRMVPGTNFARRTEDVYSTAWTLARREAVYLGLTEGVVGAVEMNYYMDNGDSFATAFEKSADRLILAPAAGVALRGAGSIVFDKINLRGGIKGIIGTDEVAVMTRELEKVLGTKGNPGARIDIARMLNESTELREINNVKVLAFRNSNEVIDEAMKNMAESTIAKQKASILKSGKKELIDFVDRNGPAHHDIANGVVAKMAVNRNGDLTVNKKKLNEIELGLLDDLGIDTSKKGDVILGYSEFRKHDIFKKTVIGDEVTITANQSLSKADVSTIRQSIAEWIEDSNELLIDRYKIKDIDAYLTKLFDDNLLAAGEYMYIKNSMPTTFLMHFVNPEMSIWRRKFKQFGMEDNLTNIAMAIGTSGTDITKIIGRRIDKEGDALDTIAIPGGGTIDKKGVNLFQEDIPLPEGIERSDFVNRLPNILAMRNDSPYHNIVNFLAAQDSGVDPTGNRVLDVNKNLLNTIKVLEAEGSTMNVRATISKFVEADINLEDIKQIHNTFQIETVEVDGVKVQKILNTETKELLDANIESLDELYKKLIDEKIRIKKDLERNAVVYEMDNKQYQEFYGDVFNQFGEQQVIAKLPLREQPRPNIDPKFAVIVRDVDFYHGYTKFADEVEDEVTPTRASEEPVVTEEVETPPVVIKAAEPVKVKAPGIIGFGGSETKVSKVIDEVEVEKVIPAGARDISDAEVTEASSEMFKKQMESLENGITPMDETLLEFLPNSLGVDGYTKNGRLSEASNMIDARKLNSKDRYLSFWDDIQSQEEVNEMIKEVHFPTYRYNTKILQMQDEYNTINRKILKTESKRNEINSSSAPNKADKILKLDEEIEDLYKQKTTNEEGRKNFVKSRPDVSDEERAKILEKIYTTFNKRLDEYMDNPMFDEKVFDYDYININGVKYKASPDEARKYKTADEDAIRTGDDLAGRELVVKTVKGKKLPKNATDKTVYVMNKRSERRIELYYQGKKMVVSSNGVFNSLGEFYKNGLGNRFNTDGSIKFDDANDALFAIIQKEANKTTDKSTIKSGDGGAVTKFRDQNVDRTNNNSAVFHYNGGKFTISKEGKDNYMLAYTNAQGKVNILGTKIRDEATAFRIISNNTDDEVNGAKALSCMLGTIGT